MPQPFRIPKDAPLNSLNWGSNALLSRPHLAAHIAKIATMWTTVEMQIGHILAAMLGIESGPAMEIFTALASTGARSDVLKAIMRPRLAADDQVSLTKLMAEYRKRSGERNAIVHGMWGTYQDREDCVLHQDPGDHLPWAARILWGDIREAKKLFEPKPGISLYTARDFENVEGRIQALIAALAGFAGDASWKQRMKEPLKERRQRALQRLGPLLGQPSERPRSRRKTNRKE